MLDHTHEVVFLLPYHLEYQQAPLSVLQVHLSRLLSKPIVTSTLSSSYRMPIYYKDDNGVNNVIITTET